MKVSTRTTITLSVLTLCLALAGTAAAKGKKYGLFVGINDYKNFNGLEGAVPDVQNMKQLLESKFGFMAANDRMLTDSQATRANILAALRTMAAKATAGDLVVFHYSGHGTLWLDSKSRVLDESQKLQMHVEFPDGGVVDYPLDYYDSAICPWDSGDETSGIAWPNYILDDELYDIFSPLTAKGVQVVFISDSCHSGTIGKAGKLKAKIRVVDPLAPLKGKTFADIQAPAKQIRAKGRQVAGNYMVLSAAQNNEFAMDAADATRRGGLFTTTLVDYVKSSKTMPTYARLMALVKTKVAEVSQSLFDNPQHPQLETRFGNTGMTIFSVK